MSTGLSVAIQLVIRAPLLIVYLAGLVILGARRDRLAPTSVRFGIAGLFALLVQELVSSASWLVVVSRIGNADLSHIGAITSVLGLIGVVLACIGVGLLIAAIVAGATRLAPPVGGPVGGPPRGGPPSGGPPSGGPPSGGPPSGGPPSGGPPAPGSTGPAGPAPNAWPPQPGQR
jgi:hypothetical protein